MSLLELSPASRRLRQAARAHAAGEISQPAYRRLRGEIIEELDIQFSASTDAEPLLPDPDETKRRDATPAARPVGSEVAIALRWHHRQLLLIGGVALLIVGLGLLVTS